MCIFGGNRLDFIEKCMLIRISSMISIGQPKLSKLPAKPSAWKECYEGSNLSRTGIAGSGIEHEFCKANHNYKAQERTSYISSMDDFDDCERPGEGTQHLEISEAKSKGAKTKSTTGTVAKD